MIIAQFWKKCNVRGLQITALNGEFRAVFLPAYLFYSLTKLPQ